jgi:glycosyltransferase involved in cell wall biosynthesis
VIAFCEKLSFNSPLVWCTFPNQVPALELWKDATVVYECMDEYALLESSIGKKLFESYESELLAKAELTVFTADNLVKTKSGGCRNHILSNNAVDHAFFSRVLYDETLDGVKVFENMNPVVGYVGAVREWMDLPLLRSVIAALPGINFLFIGPVGTNVSSLLNYKNVQFTGAVNYTQLPAYLKYIDVTMVPFQNNDIIGNTNPIKIYEYLAAGKPVVTTYFEETKRFGEFVSVIRSSYEMTSAITDLITSDNAELRKRRSEFAAQHTWERRAQEILSKLTGIPKIHMNK